MIVGACGSVVSGPSAATCELCETANGVSVLLGRVPDCHVSVSRLRHAELEGSGTRSVKDLLDVPSNEERGREWHRERGREWDPELIMVFIRHLSGGCLEPDDDPWQPQHTRVRHCQRVSALSRRFALSRTPRTRDSIDCCTLIGGWLSGTAAWMLTS